MEKSKLLDGAGVRAGDVLIGIASSGPHSNGYSLVRRIYERAGAPAEHVLEDGTRLIDALMAPTASTSSRCWRCWLPHGAAIHGMAHVTGGGLTENIIRVILEGLGLDIRAASWPLPPVFQWLQREGAVADSEMWRTFNCGIGFVLVADPAQAAALEQAIDAQGCRTGASAKSWPLPTAANACISADPGMTTLPPLPAPVAVASADDLAHLRLLAVFHYVVAGLTALFALIPSLHLALGIAMVSGAISAEDPDARWAGWFFIAFAAIFIIC